jgi:hypothetical protein
MDVRAAVILDAQALEWMEATEGPLHDPGSPFAYHIAGKNRADPGSMKAAIRLAIQTRATPARGRGNDSSNVRGLIRPSV